jgi:hypothetical protein
MKKFGILVVIAMLVCLLVVPAASAQGITWTSGFQVQNLGTATATLTITYYNQDGSVAATVADSIAASGSKTYFPLSAVADGFNGSVVISSDQPVVAIANTLGNYPQYTASTESFSAGANSVQLPLIMRANSGYYTWFNVQNVGTADASVTVQYVRGSDGNNYTAPAVTIKPGAAQTFDQHDLTQLGTKFIGSAVVTANQPIVASVMQVGETYRNMMGYNGFTGGSTKVSMPLIMANNSGYYTGYQVQNVGGSSATINITYGTNLAAGGFVPTNETATLAPNESKTFQQIGGQWTGTYVGSATITSNQPIVAIVNQVKMTAPVLGTAYDGFNPDAATAKVSMPLVMNANSTLYTGFQVMNVGTSATTITVTFSPNTGGGYVPASETATIDPGNSYNSIQAAKWGSNKYIGSAIVTAGAGGKIVAIVNEAASTWAGDQFMTYNAFNY